MRLPVCKMPIYLHYVAFVGRKEDVSVSVKDDGVRRGEMHL